MKKTITTLCLLSTIYGFSQTIEFEDPMFKSKLLQINSTNISTSNFYAEDANGNSITVDSNGDGEIQIAEALNIKKLKLTSPSSTLQLSSVAEISYFTNLTELNFSNNNISEIDFTGLELLEKVSLSKNKISELDVTNLTNLKTLSIQNNLLTSLNVSNKEELYLLDCDGNDLEELNIENTSNLQTLGCSNNALTTLDISDSPINMFYGHNNNLISLNMNNGVITSSAHIFKLEGNPNLATICADSGEISWLQNYLASVDINNVSVTNCSSLSLDNTVTKDENIKIFPNPVVDYVYIESTDSAQIEKIRVYSADGKIQFDEQNISNSIKLDLSKLSRGLYVIMIYKEGNVITEKIIKN